MKEEKETRIEKGLSFYGDLSAKGPIVIGGYLQGRIYSQDRVHILSSAKVFADIKAKELMVEGFIEGNAQIENSIVIYPTGCIKGDIQCKNLVVHSGGIHVGVSLMPLPKDAKKAS